MKTRALVAGATACLAMGVMSTAAFAQVSPPEPPQEVCDAIDDAGSEVQGVEETVEAGSGQSLPASPGSNVRTSRYTLGCRFEAADDDTDATGPDPAPAPAGPSGGSEVLPASSDPATAPRVAPTSAETLPATGGGMAPPAGALLALAAGVRLGLRRFGG